jgi:hypothetical protein
MGGTYVKTNGKTGDAKLLITPVDGDTVSISFKICK